MLFFAAAAITAVGAPVTCTTETLEYFQNLPEGCVAGEFTFKNFAWTSEQGGNAVRVPASAIIASPAAAGDLVTVNYFSDSFEVSGDNYIYATLDYLIDPPPPILDGFALSMSAFSPVAPGTAAVTAYICGGDLFADACVDGFTRRLRVQHLGTSAVLFDSVDFPFRVNMIDVRLTIELFANGASSQIDGFGQEATLTPEPGTALIAAAGLALLALLRARARHL